MSKYSKTKELWSQWYQKGTYTQATNQSKHVETSKRLVDIYGPQMKDSSVFCELGAGSGRNIYYFHDKYPQWTYIGNDINPNIHNEIKSIYPDLLSWAEIQIIDTLTYLRKEDFQTDITFTHGHLMHLPNDVIDEACDLIARKTRRYILLYEAYLNDKGISLRKKLKYKKYRFDRDYEGMFPGFVLKEKLISSHKTKKWIRQCTYFFTKESFT
jgi:hypothetical protein